MKTIPHVVAAVALTVWWAPTFAVMILRATPQRAAQVGTRYRLARAAELIDLGRAREAERVLGALKRDLKAAERRIMR